MFVYMNVHMSDCVCVIGTNLCVFDYVCVCRAYSVCAHVCILACVLYNTRMYKS